VSPDKEAADRDHDPAFADASSEKPGILPIPAQTHDKPRWTKVLQRKLEASRLKTSGEADEISNEYAGIHLSKNDIPKLIAFLKLLDDVPDNRFRELVIKATVLDTSTATE
jgi:hypothetical protein